MLPADVVMLALPVPVFTAPLNVVVLPELVVNRPPPVVTAPRVKPPVVAVALMAAPPEFKVPAVFRLIPVPFKVMVRLDVVIVPEALEETVAPVEVTSSVPVPLLMAPLITTFPGPLMATFPLVEVIPPANVLVPTPLAVRLTAPEPVVISAVEPTVPAELAVTIPDVVVTVPPKEMLPEVVVVTFTLPTPVLTVPFNAVALLAFVVKIPPPVVTAPSVKPPEVAVAFTAAPPEFNVLAAFRLIPTPLRVIVLFVEETPPAAEEEIVLPVDVMVGVPVPLLIPALIATAPGAFNVTSPLVELMAAPMVIPPAPPPIRFT